MLIFSSLLARCHEGDSLYRSLMPNEADRAQQLVAMFEHDIRVGLGRAQAIFEEGRRAVSFWHPPNGTRPRFPMPGAVPAARPILRGRLWRAQRSLVRAEQRLAPADHWFLSHFAVSPSVQGRGIGASMLRAGLDLVDADGRSCWLETTRSSDSSFYECAGFVTVAVLTAAGVPATAVMRREARIRPNSDGAGPQLGGPAGLWPMSVDRSRSKS